MTIYKGTRTDAGCVVTVNDRPLNPRFDLRNHSPDGFEWGYGGSGPAQLALAILAYELGSPAAVRWYQDFKAARVASIQADEWTMDGNDIRSWYQLIRQEIGGAS